MRKIKKKKTHRKSSYSEMRHPITGEPLKKKGILTIEEFEAKFAGKKLIRYENGLIKVVDEEAEEKK